MLRYLLRRLIALPLLLLLANFFGYAYAYYLAPVQLARGPYARLAGEMPPIFSQYLNYLSQALRGDLGQMHTGEPISTHILRAGQLSLGLLAISLLLSVLVGLFLGLRSVRSDPPRVAAWLTITATLGLASPSFFVGILFISLSVLFLLYGPTNEILFPFQGYGWDSHLILPVLALAVRPTVQLAQITSGLLATELEKQYVTAARSFGHTLQAIRGRYALRNIIVPVVLTVAGSVRLLVAELIIIERLFGWPGLGRSFSGILVMTSHSDSFMSPPLLAALLTAMVGLFLVTDLAAGFIVRLIDHRLR